MEASSGKTVTLNEKAHTLLFTCIEDLCEHETRVISAGDADETVEVDLKIKPARLTVAGDPAKSYVIKEKPTLALPVNVPVDVPMTRKTERVHVRELITDKEVVVQLVAGQVARASFTDEP
jgi:hypothetical protein